MVPSALRSFIHVTVDSFGIGAVLVRSVRCVIPDVAGVKRMHISCVASTGLPSLFVFCVIDNFLWSTRPHALVGRFSNDDGLG